MSAQAVDGTPAAGSEGAVFAPIRAFDVEVADVVRLSPTFVRVTFAGESLAHLDDGGALGPRDLRVKVMVPSPGRELPDFSDLSGGWYQQWLAMDPQVRGSMRTYTVRRARVRGADPQVDIDFALHLDSRAVGGPASTWASEAVPGGRLTILGPDVRGGPSGGVEWHPPTDVGPLRVLLAGDETAVPAIGSILESLPSGIRGHAVLEVPVAEDFQDLTTAADIEVTWLARGPAPRGLRLTEGVRAAVSDVPTPARPATTALSEVDVDRAILWETPEGPTPSDQAAGSGAAFYGWLAGEAAVMRDLRRHLVRERGVDRRQLSFMGYWREGRDES